ncbi:hypothetical protein [Sagittula stellata]|uniref:hypothetical protein n=1 Tax=Sagittula stellata TaxID=52603 RepID=UPI00321B24F2
MASLTRFTRKQTEIMERINRGSAAGGFIDIDELLGDLSYTCTKQALQCSLRKLRDRGLIEDDYIRRRGARRRMMSLTRLGRSFFDPQTGAFDVVVEGIDED